MGLVAAPAFVGARGIDTVAVLTAQSAAALKKWGVDYVVRYGGSLTAGEVGVCTAAGLRVMMVGYSRAPGWQPTAGTGTDDGNTAVIHAKQAGLLLSTCLFCDVEGCAGTAADVIAYCTAWFQAVHGAGYTAAIYVGAGNLLNAAQLMALPFTCYWKSLSAVEAPSCGWQMIQLYPSVTVAGVYVDISVVQQDYHRRVPIWTQAA